MPAEPGPTEAAERTGEVRAFGPGRVNLIGEHTDYNGGLALPFAIAEGVTVRARTRQSAEDPATGGATVGGDVTPAGEAPKAGGVIEVHARDLDEHDEFSTEDPERAEGWRGFVRGMVAELTRAGFRPPAAELEISGDIERGSGLSSSAALEVSLCLALLELTGAPPDGGLDRRDLARLCSRVENEWVGAHTGLLDQLASLFGEPESALLIDFSDLSIERVPLTLGEGWRLVTLDSGETHSIAESGYNERREECARACRLLGIASLREVRPSDLGELPEILIHRVRHVIEENRRVRETVHALQRGDLERVGRLLDASHASLRDLYECSTPAVERAVDRLHEAGAVGARIMGGGFGGHVLGLLPPAARTPEGAREVRPAAGARVLD